MIDFTNIDDVTFFILSIAKVGGYDYFKLLMLDTDELLDLAEFEGIWAALVEIANKSD